MSLTKDQKELLRLYIEQKIEEGLDEFVDIFIQSSTDKLAGFKSWSIENVARLQVEIDNQPAIKQNLNEHKARFDSIKDVTSL